MSADRDTSRDEKIALLNLLAVDGVGPATTVRLVSTFGSATAVFKAGEVDLKSVPRISDAVAARIKATFADHEVGSKQVEAAEAAGAMIISYWDDNYPPLLKKIESDAPAMLFVRGNFVPQALRLAVVGTRSATSYGKRMSHDLVAGLRGRGVHIVSGLASGIDGSAHESALECGLPTEAVFGCGVDVVYPPANTSLANRILASGGALISEYPCGTQPDRAHFPQRNRIIAGLSQATLVIEAGESSGALITAHLSIEYNRDVLAVPGAVNNPKTRGCHSLIRDGATLIEKSEDILRVLDSRVAAATAARVQQELVVALPPNEQELFDKLDAAEAVHVDELAANLGSPVGQVLGRLLMLELKGMIKQLPGKYFVRA